MKTSQWSSLRKSELIPAHYCRQDQAIRGQVSVPTKADTLLWEQQDAALSDQRLVWQHQSTWSAMCLRQGVLYFSGKQCGDEVMGFLQQVRKYSSEVLRLGRFAI